MTWHLKDRELENKLEEFTGGNFVNSLNQVIESDGIDSEFVVWVGFGRKLLGDDDSDNCLLFRTDELEEVSEYNPKAWNEYPAVKPPEGEMMRVEYFSLILRKLGRTCAIFCNGQWFVEIDGEPDTEFPLEETMIKVKRFRPWED